MKHASDDAYTIMIFRGATSTPRRIKLRKTTVRRGAMIALFLVLVQSGILAHYVIQFSQVAELNALRKEIAESRGQTSAFSAAIDEMKQRMLAMQQLNRKLQTMFGLEADPIELVPEPNTGQGGEEIPYEWTGTAEEGKLPVGEIEKASVSDQPGQAHVEHVIKIRNGLSWLDYHVDREQEILNRLTATAGERAERWASTPSIWPVKGPITSRFGPRISPFTGKKAFHSGLDIGSPRGTEVRAPAAGKVVVAAFDNRMGQFIRINHGSGIETTYGHLSKILVKYGKEVERGELIGLVGNTGKFSTGPHLHYQVSVNDQVVDPLQYILD